MNIPATQAILFVFLIACISQWWLRLFFAPFCAFAILAAVQEASDWRKLLGAFLLLFAPSLASAEIVGVETVGVCNGNQCTSVTGYGSGVIVGTLRDGRAAVLTAGHVVAGSQSVHIGWYRGQRLAATVLGSRNDGMVDAAILAVRIPGEFHCNELSESVTPDAKVLIEGYPEGMTTVQSYPGLLNGRTIHKVTARQGMSGGPVMHDGKVVGIIRGHYVDGNRDSICTPGPVLCAWLRETIGYVPQCSTPKPAVKPSPIAVAPPPPRDEVDLSPVLAKLSAIEKRIQCLEKMPLPSGPPGLLGEVGPPGPRGEKGERCPMGPPGANGTPADYRQLDRLRDELDAVREELAAMKTARIKVQIKSNGQLIDEDTYPITGPIVLDFRATERRDVPASE
jgi:hypothetical protein